MTKKISANKNQIPSPESSSVQNEENGINDPEQKTEKRSFYNSNDLVNYLLENEKSYTIDEILQEYRLINEGFVKVMEYLSLIFNLSKPVVAEDLDMLNATKYYYRKRKILNEDTSLFQYDVFKNILEVTFKATIKKAKLFFGYSVEEWDIRANMYRTLSFKISETNYKVLISHIDRLLFSLKELYNDYYGINNEFNFWYSFNDVLEISKEMDDLGEKMQFVKKIIAECKEYCLIDGYNTTTKKQEDEFIQKCQKLVDLIDYQIENGISINPALEEIENDEIKLQEKDDRNALPEVDIKLRRQFLAIYYLLNEVDKEVLYRNKSEFSRFVQLLTGKSYINIYKLAKNPVKDPEERISQQYQNDLQFVKQTFRNLGLDKIAHQIDNDNLVG